MGVVQGTNTPDFLIAREAIFQDLKTKSPLRGSLLFGGEGGIHQFDEFFLLKTMACNFSKFES